jgi:Asp-tRNA(Asn)/Glu-tRNA(Gln) amidotransferase A subunit family amidase
MVNSLLRLLIIGLCASCAQTPQQHLNTQADFDVIELTLEQAHQAIMTQAVNCEQLTERYLKRIEAFDQPSQVNSIIYVNPNAIGRARQLDRKFAVTGEMKKLHCASVILKDNFDTVDMPTEAGSIAMKGSFPPDDAFLVKRLREEDAIIIAKSNMGEWAFSPNETISSTHGQTRNVYDLNHVPAGSSGGTASAIAANFGIIGMGTDTGNSIRGPASHLALVGIRPTIGATSRDGVVPLLANRDVGGPLMRTVWDTAIVFSVLAGYDPADPATEASRGRIIDDYVRQLKPDGLRGVRLGVLRALVDTETVDFEVLDHMGRAIADLKKTGAVIVDPFVIPNFDRLKNATGFCSRFRYDLGQYLNTLGNSAPIRSLDEVADSGRFLERSATAMQWAMGVDSHPQSQTPPCVDVQGDPRRKEFLDAVLASMDAARVDAIIYPTWGNPPREIGDNESPHGNNSPIIAPHTGQPAITVPMGFAESGLPLGLQLLARPFDEHKLFQYAYAYEQATRHRKPPAGFGAIAVELELQ